MRSHFPISPLTKIPTEFSQPKPAALHCLTEKNTWCFWRCFLRMTEGKGEKHRREEPGFQHPVHQLVQWICNKDLEGKDGVCGWWIPGLQSIGEQEQAALKDLVHKPCFSSSCDKCDWGKAVAEPARPEVQILFTNLYSQHWGERRKPRLRWISVTKFSLAIPNIESFRKFIRQLRHLQVGQAMGCKCPL